MKKIFLILYFCVVFPSAQTLEVLMSADSVMLAEICTMTVVFPEGVKPLSLLNQREWSGAVRFRDGREISSATETKFQIVLSLYEAPVCTIPPLSFLVQMPDGARDTLKTDPIAVKVASILEQLDSAALRKLTKYGAINPMRAGRAPILETILILALIIAAVVLAVYLLKRYINKKKAQIVVVLPPFEEAMGALLALDDHNLIDGGEYKAFVFSLSAILKRFVSRRYDVSIEEATSTEFKQWARRSGELNRENKHLIENFINETDPVKFADITPSVENLRKLRANVEEFVKSARPIEHLSAAENNN